MLAVQHLLRGTDHQTTLVNIWAPTADPTQFIEADVSLVPEGGHRPTIDDLVQFVDVTIVNKSHRRSFDLPSRVANSREGDGTEHAVLLTALARATQWPARVVVGILIVERPERLFAFGHAWAEIHDGSQWIIADATRPDGRPRYLPLGSLESARSRTKGRDGHGQC